MGMASSRSSPLPWGTPSMMSMSTTSASSLEAIQWAAVAPTFPEPTMVTFLRMRMSPFENRITTKGTKVHEGIPICPGSPLCPSWFKRLLHQHACAQVFDHVAGEFAGLYLGGAGHQALEIVGHFLLLDRALHALLDQVPRFIPTEVTKHHDAGQDNRTGIDDVLVGILGRSAMGSFEDGVAV